MSNLVGCMAMSHAPQLMLNPDYWHLLNTRAGEQLPEKPGMEKETHEVKWAKWNRCMDAITKLRAKIDALRPDVLIVVGAEVEASVSLRYLNQLTSENRTKYRIDAKIAEALVHGLMDEGFDPSYSKKTRYEGGLGHAFARVLKFLSPQAHHAVVPVMVNTYYPPAPSARRCVKFGAALASLVRRFPNDDRVVVIGSGGLSHTKIDEELDQRFIQALKQNELDTMSTMPASVLVEGTSEIRNWIVTASAANRSGTLLDYFPLYRTRTGVGCAMGFAYWDVN